MSFKYKLGFGPMSNEVIDALISYSLTNSYPLMIIASRNQVDYVSGYVCDTTALSKKVKNSKADILLCRDHCGPGFKDSDRDLSFDKKLNETFKTIDNDLDNNFDLIHIDVSRVEDDQLKIAEKLLTYVLKQNDKCLLEFGSEENLGKNIVESHKQLDEHLDFLTDYKNNLVFYTSQTGSLTKHTQVGIFDVPNTKIIAEKVHKNGFLLKEHNADYIDIVEIQKRKVAGVDALNIAPQLGQLQTTILQKLIMQDLDSTAYWNSFANKVYNSNIWQRWLPENYTNKNLAVLVSGHYFYNSDEYKRCMDVINYDDYRYKINKGINELLNVYRTIGE